MVKDTLERATEPSLNLYSYLEEAYVHPVFKDSEVDRPKVVDEEENNPLVPTKRKSSKNSEYNSDTDARL